MGHHRLTLDPLALQVPTLAQQRVAVPIAPVVWNRPRARRLGDDEPRSEQRADECPVRAAELGRRRLARRRAARVDAGSGEAVADFYMHLWKCFFACYALLPFVR